MHIHVHIVQINTECIENKKYATLVHSAKEPTNSTGKSGELKVLSKI